MAVLELTRTVHPSTVASGLGVERILNAGESLKLELGDDELVEVCPPGEKWDVRVSIHVSIADV